MREFFERHFLLTDHPFSPDNARFVSPDWLRVFEGDDAARQYFSRLDAFAEAISAVERFLADQSWPIENGTPPALLVRGPEGSGRKTFANFVADALRQLCRDRGLPLPGFSVVKVPSESYARLLEAIRGPVNAHLGRHGIDWRTAGETLGPFNPNEPNQDQLEGLFQTLSENVAPNSAVNVLVIGPITPRRDGWMRSLRKLLSPLRVFPVFFTDDRTVAAIFDATPEQAPRLAVEISAITAKDAMQVLRRRFDILKTAARQQRNVDTLFPYTAEVVERLFPKDGKNGVKLFVKVCNAAFSVRMGRLRDHETNPMPSAPSATVSWDDFEAAIRSGFRVGGR